MFTDFDLLNSMEMDALGHIALAVETSHPEMRILNKPTEVLERYSLLRTLRDEGLNRVEIHRIEEGTIPTRYPVFIRSEDGARGPETALFNNSDELRRQIELLKSQGFVAQTT